MANPVVTFEMENGDIMKAELYPEIAANTVRNFISLVKKMLGVVEYSLGKKVKRLCFSDRACIIERRIP